MKRVVLTLFVLLGWMSAEASIALSDSAHFSWITCQPSGEEVYTLFGHTALRVVDEPNNIDYIFNYGIFSFEQPHFIPKFVKGETDYQLGLTYTQSFLSSYYHRGSVVYEQALNLTHEERERLWDALSINYLPENREYRYNFVFDNCATRPIMMLQLSLEGEMVYGGVLLNTTYRRLVTEHVGYDNWPMFGIDLVFGVDADAPIGANHEELFLPMYVRERLGKSVIVSEEGERPLVVEEHQYSALDVSVEETSWFVRPIVVLSALLILIVVLSIVESRKKKYFVWLDVTLFSVVGVLGLIIFFLMFISVHPLVQSNWNLAWAHPLQIVVPILLCFKKLRNHIVYYQYVNVALILLTLIVGTIGVQVLHVALWPLLATLLVRSVLYILNFGKHK